MDRATVIFDPQGAVARVAVGTTVAEAARLAEVRVDVPCGGAGVCGGCTVLVSGEVSPPTRDEEGTLSPAELERGVRLACRARVMGDLSVRPVSTPVVGGVRAVTASTVEGFPVDPLAHGGRCRFGVAVDVGTTTLAAALVDLRNGDIAATASADNPQAAFGADVLTRVSRAMEDGVGELSAALTSAIEDLVSGMLAAEGIEAGDLCAMTLAGNTAMTHFLLGIEPSALAAAPYEGAALGSARRHACALGMPRLGEVPAYVLPGVSAFVGGDTVAGVVVTRLEGRPPGTVFVDLGTNGEIVLRGKEGLVAASAAAGPAFEGASIECGTRAEAGAIERASWSEGRLDLGTVDGAEPRGICGSGLVGLVAALLDAGVIDPEGRMRATGPLGGRVSERDGGRLFEVAEGVVLTQEDVRQLQLAKAAVRAALTLLLDDAGIAEDDVVEVIVAGGFGYHAEEASLVRTGVLPAAWRGRVVPAGNTALAGSVAVLASASARDEAERVSGGVRTLDLATHPGFRDAYIGSMGFPEA